MMSSLSGFGVSSDVTVVENNFSKAHWNPSYEINWNGNMPQQPEIGQQIPHCVQQTQETSRNIVTQPSIEEPNPVYENLIEELASTTSYQEYNSHLIPQTYYSQSGNLHCLLQNSPTSQFHQINEAGCFNKIHPRHYQSHTSYVKTKAGLKAITKRKRKRTMFTTEQVAVLEKVFQSKPYINREERQALVEELQINDKVIKVWFQNRRLKEKRDAEEAEQELYLPDADAEATETKNQFDELSYIESQINQTDKFGFVTLDDRAMNGLVRVIENILSEEVQVNLLEESGAGDSPYQLPEESEGSCIYEPISPASSNESNSDTSVSFEPYEPKESLQRIFDIQEFLIFNKKTV